MPPQPIQLAKKNSVFKTLGEVDKKIGLKVADCVRKNDLHPLDGDFKEKLNQIFKWDELNQTPQDNILTELTKKSKMTYLNKAVEKKEVKTQLDTPTPTWRQDPWIVTKRKKNRQIQSPIGGSQITYGRVCWRAGQGRPCNDKECHTKMAHTREEWKIEKCRRNCDHASCDYIHKNETHEQHAIRLRNRYPEFLNS